MIAVDQLHRFGAGSSTAALPAPGTSDLNFLRNLDGIVDLNTKISNRTLNFGMAQ
jgi:hypothetical protein